MEAAVIAQPAAPLVSVITPCLNAGRTLPATLASVAAAAQALQQRGHGLEHWLVDGGSSDGSEILLAEHGARQWWCQVLHGGANGPYPAMNLGLAQARGHFVHVLNADDALLDPVAYAEALIQAQRQGAAFILAAIGYVKGPQRGLGRIWPVRPLPQQVSDWHSQLRRGLHYPHPGFVAERCRYQRQGFDPRYQLSADYKLMQALLLAAQPAEVLVVQQPLVAMAAGGRSGTWGGRLCGARELQAINRELGIQAPLWRRYGRKLMRGLGQQLGGLS